jgi:monooxygenase
MNPSTREMPETLDLVIIGAGLSGIGAAVHLQKALPDATYIILEGREQLGGTWDLFRYPGIRSDSDMFTLGYSFRPWTDPKAIADGASILAYLRDTAETYGVDRHITYNRRVERAKWSTTDARWEVEARDPKTGELHRVYARFLFSCTGYYDYAEGYTPELPGREKFRGRVVHPQHWTEDIAYDNANVVVIGSGATAVTLVPALAKRASHVTMLQRSPSYVVSLPSKDRFAQRAQAKLPERGAYTLTRWKNVLFSMGFYEFCRRAPKRSRRYIVDHMTRKFAGSVDRERDLSPAYAPWDQRLCLVPDGDLFKAVRSGKASVVTDHIETFTEDGIRLRSGRELKADLIVTATGLNLKFGGGAKLEVDGREVSLTSSMVYKGLMLSDVPNLAFVIGYTNASWTLKADLTAQYVCRLLKHMRKKQYAVVMPRRTDDNVGSEPLLHLSSGYVRRAQQLLPSQGSRAPWKLFQNYPLDLAFLRLGRIEDGVLRFHRRGDSAPA